VIIDRHTHPADVISCAARPGRDAAGADGVMVDVTRNPESRCATARRRVVGESLDEAGPTQWPRSALLGRTSAAHLAG